MSMRRPSSVYVLSQVSETSVKRRRSSTNGSCCIYTATFPPHDGGFPLLPAPTSPSNQQGHAVSKLMQAAKQLRQTVTAWRRSCADLDTQHSELSFDALWKLRDQRVELLRQLSNPWPECNPIQPRPSRTIILGSPCLDPIPHALFRKRLPESVPYPKLTRRLLRTQLFNCKSTRDVLLIVACAMQTRPCAEELARMPDELMRAMYRCRNNASDPEVLRTIGIIIARFRFAKIPVQPELVHLALKFAARCRTVSGMRKYLRMMKDENHSMNGDLFRSIIGKCSIGHQGLGEIRNGRWRRRHLLQVLLGFDDDKHLPESQKCHLGTFLVRNNWTFLHGWIAILGRCRADDMIRQEWELWKLTASRLQPTRLIYGGEEILLTSKTRGECWFVEQMALAGNLESAWRIFYESDIRFESVKMRIRYKMLDAPEYVREWVSVMRESMREKYAFELERIEKALGVRWIPPDPAFELREGRHEVVEDPEEAWDRLGDPNWEADHQYGYPYDSEPLVSDTDRALHSALESAPLKT